ncbi:hypothetical protein [Tateyamaria sp.]|uniref:hypothetical protein n=1 Tax=Tateyamaria sp. TaxID=1929288 RepID=UPI003B224B00
MDAMECPLNKMSEVQRAGEIRFKQASILWRLRGAVSGPLDRLRFMILAFMTKYAGKAVLSCIAFILRNAVHADAFRLFSRRFRSVFPGLAP